MPTRWVVLLLMVAATLIGGSAAAADESAYRTRDACDCEAVGSLPIRQPFNAWSSLALIGAGAWVAERRRRTAPADAALGWALAATGTAAFWYHATLTGWGAVLDEAALAALAATVAAHQWRHRIAFPVGAAIGLLAAAGAVAAGGGSAAALGLSGAALIGHMHRGAFGDMRLAAAAGMMLTVGALLWWAARGPWCDPSAWFRPHAVWHVVAAGAGVLALRYLRSCETPPSLYPAAEDPRHEGP